MSERQIKVSIIIVNWNGREHLEICLNSVLQQTYKNFSIIIVDNGSSDDSVEFIKKHYQQVTLIE